MERVLLSRLLRRVLVVMNKRMMETCNKYGDIYIVAVETVLSLLAIISASVPNDLTCALMFGSTYAYFKFTAISYFIGSFVWYFVYLLAITRKLGFVRWDIGELIWLACYGVMYLIVSGMMASNACSQGGYKAAAAFGFICAFAIIGHGFFAGRAFWEKMRGSSRQSTSTTETTDEEENKY